MTKKLFSPKTRFLSAIFNATKNSWKQKIIARLPICMQKNMKFRDRWCSKKKTWSQAYKAHSEYTLYSRVYCVLCLCECASDVFETKSFQFNMWMTFLLTLPTLLQMFRKFKLGPHVCHVNNKIILTVILVRPLQLLAVILSRLFFLAEIRNESLLAFNKNGTKQFVCVCVLLLIISLFLSHSHSVSIIMVI